MDLRKLPAGVLLLLCLAVPLCAGILGSLATSSSLNGWYLMLAKPPITPPGWLFAPVWTLLYILMGVSLFLILRSGVSGDRIRPALGWFSIQLFLNILWSVAFFGLHSPLLGLGVIVLLILSIAATLGSFVRISRPAGLLLVPYLCWVCFASVLNFWVFLLNP